MISSKFTAVSRQLSCNNLFKTSKYSATRLNSSQSNTSSILVDVNDKSGYATVTLNSPPVNSLNLELLSTFSNVLDDLKKNNSRGMILTSSSPSVFCAGLDINEMYKPDKERARKFWSTLQDCWIKLYGSEFPTAAAINGHSPAGGCLLSMSCEYRVMLPKFTIGLNETQLGIVAPTWFMATMRNTISNREAELALTLGRMFTTEEALKIGMIDEIAASKEEAIEKCTAFLDKYKKIPPLARGLTKQHCRQTDIQELVSNKEADVELFVTAITDQRIQKSLGKYVAFLKWKSRMKPIMQAFKFVSGLFKPKKSKK